MAAATIGTFGYRVVTLLTTSRHRARAVSVGLQKSGAR